MINIESLINFGLTKNEAKVYVALLKLGSGSAMEITKKSKVHRVNTYDVLERLIKKGLIGTVINSNKKIYEVGNPDQLMKLLKEKEESLSLILPQLKKEFKAKKEKQSVYHFLGIEGVMQAYFMMLDENSIIYALGGSGLNRQYLKHRHELWNKERKRKKIKVKGIYYESARNIKNKTWNDSTVLIRYLPNKYKTLGMVDICGNLIVNLIPVVDNIMAIVIENKILADTYRNFFKVIWDFAKQ